MIVSLHEDFFNKKGSLRGNSLGRYFEILAVDVLHHHHDEDSYYQDGRVLEHRPPVARLVVCQRAARAEYFEDADDAKEEKDHPDDFVAFEYVANRYLHVVLF